MQLLVPLLFVALRAVHGHDDSCTSESCLSSVALLQAAVKVHGEANESANKRVAAVYRGPAGDGTSAGEILEGTGQWRVVYIGPNDKSIADGLKGAKLYVQPGGGDKYMEGWNAVKDYKRALTQFVGNGGNFIGICMGAYIANDEPKMPGFGFSTAFAENFNYIDRPGAEVSDAEDHVITVYWPNRDWSASQQVYFQNGPSFKFVEGLSDSDKAKCKVLAWYQNKDIAAMTMPYRSGRVGIMGPHPEIPYDGVFPKYLFLDLVKTIVG